LDFVPFHLELLPYLLRELSEIFSLPLKTEYFFEYQDRSEMNASVC
jgi:hypothetical protein